MYNLFSLIDAKNNRVYYGLNKLYKTDDNKITIEKILDVNNELIEDVVKNISQKDILIAGNCINNFKDTYIDPKFTTYNTKFNTIDGSINTLETSVAELKTQSSKYLTVTPVKSEDVK